MDEEEWGADDDTKKAITSDFEGEWGDRRQELVLISEKLDVKGLTKLLDECLLSRAQMRRWENIMHDANLDQGAKEETLAELWDDGCWAEWLRADDDGGHDHHHENRSYEH